MTERFSADKMYYSLNRSELIDILFIAAKFSRFSEVMCLVRNRCISHKIKYD